MFVTAWCASVSRHFIFSEIFMKSVYFLKKWKTNDIKAKLIRGEDSLNFKIKWIFRCFFSKLFFFLFFVPRDSSLLDKNRSFLACRIVWFQFPAYGQLSYSDFLFSEHVNFSDNDRALAMIILVNLIGFVDKAFN